MKNAVLCTSAKAKTYLNVYISFFLTRKTWYCFGWLTDSCSDKKESTQATSQ